MFNKIPRGVEGKMKLMAYLFTSSLLKCYMMQSYVVSLFCQSKYIIFLHPSWMKTCTHFIYMNLLGLINC